MAKEYGNLNLDKAKKLKSLESENARLKKLVADLSLDNAILKEATEGTTGHGWLEEAAAAGSREAV